MTRWLAQAGYDMMLMRLGPWPGLPDQKVLDILPRLNILRENFSVFLCSVPRCEKDLLCGRHFIKWGDL